MDIIKDRIKMATKLTEMRAWVQASIQKLKYSIAFELNTEDQISEAINYFIIQSRTRRLIASDRTCTLKQLRKCGYKALKRNGFTPALITITESELRKARKGQSEISALLLYGSVVSEWGPNKIFKSAEVYEKIILKTQAKLFRDKRSMVAAIAREEDSLNLSAPAFKLENTKSKERRRSKYMNIFFSSKEVDQNEVFYLISIGQQHISAEFHKEVVEITTECRKSTKLVSSGCASASSLLRIREDLETQDHTSLQYLYNSYKKDIDTTKTDITPFEGKSIDPLHAGPEYDYLSVNGWTKSSSPQGIRNTIAYLSRAWSTPSKGPAILATARNEAIYLPDWCAYHFALGFEKIFLYTNSNNDYTLEVANRLRYFGLNILVIENNISNSSTAPQIKAYRHALSIGNEILDHEWCATIDIDEYIAIKRVRGENSIGQWLNSLMKSSALVSDVIALNWIFAGTDKNFKDFGNCTEPVSRRIQLSSARSPIIKCLFKPKFFLCALPHYPLATMQYVPLAVNASAEIYGEYQTADPMNSPSVSENPSYNQAAVIHYYHKSEPEFVWKKSRTGGARIVQDKVPDASIAEQLSLHATNKPDKAFQWLRQVRASEKYKEITARFSEDVELQRLLAESAKLMQSKYQDWMRLHR